jgi:hypothetical protein
MARSFYSRIFVQANAPQYCSFQPNRRQRMRRSLKRKRKHNRLVQTGNTGGRRRTIDAGSGTSSPAEWSRQYAMLGLSV